MTPAPAMRDLLERCWSATGADLPENITAALNAFDKAARDHGWQEDQGSLANAVEAKKAWEFARAQLEAAIRLALPDTETPHE